MKRTAALSLALALTAVLASPQTTPSRPDPPLKRGMEHVSFTKVYAPADTAAPLRLSSFRYAEESEGGCPLPSTTTRISVKLSRAQGPTLHEQELPVSYSFVAR